MVQVLLFFLQSWRFKPLPSKEHIVERRGLTRYEKDGFHEIQFFHEA
jgi:hypothetical protein